MREIEREKKQGIEGDIFVSDREREKARYKGRYFCQVYISRKREIDKDICEGDRERKRDRQITLIKDGSSNGLS